VFCGRELYITDTRTPHHTMNLDWSRFLDWNRRLSGRIDAWLPRDRRDLFREYRELVRAEILRRERPWVLDLGGGNMCEFRRARERIGNERVIALDIGIDGLQNNPAVDGGIAADLSRAIPLIDDGVEITASSRMLEHLPDVDRFLKENLRVLKPGGLTIHAVPCRNAPFAVIKRLLPHRLGVAVVKGMFGPASAEFCWSPLHYQHCTGSGLSRALRQAGFERVTVRVAYGQAQHFAALTPLFVLNIVYEWIVAGLHLRNLAAYVLVTGYKPV
jgi:SAM-dependent methyltransferase